MNPQHDVFLPYSDKIKLIGNIEYWQNERWIRLRRWRNLTDLTISVKHLFMRKEIELIRQQKKRLSALKQSIYG